MMFNFSKLMVALCHLFVRLPGSMLTIDDKGNLVIKINNRQGFPMFQGTLYNDALEKGSTDLEIVAKELMGVFISNSNTN